MECDCKEICQWTCDEADKCMAKIMRAYRDNLELKKDREIVYEEKFKEEE